MTFSGETIFFLQKCLNLCMCFSLISSTTFPCIFFAWFALCLWEKQRQNIEACTMNTIKQNKSISAWKRYRRMFFHLIEKHMQKFRHFWRKKISPLYVPLAPSHSIVYYQVLVSNHMGTQSSKHKQHENYLHSEHL